MMLNASWRENLVRRLRQMCLTAASGGSMAMLSFRRNLDMDAVLLAIEAIFISAGRYDDMLTVGSLGWR